jgi:hypothetical protein
MRDGGDKSKCPGTARKPCGLEVEVSERHACLPRTSGGG